MDPQRSKLDHQWRWPIGIRGIPQPEKGGGTTVFVVEKDWDGVSYGAEEPWTAPLTPAYQFRQCGCAKPKIWLAVKATDGIDGGL